MQNEPEVFPKQDYASETFIQTGKVLWWARLILYLSGAVQLCELALNIMRLILANRYLSHNLPAHARETLFNGCTGIIMGVLRASVLCLAFVALYRLKQYYKDDRKETLMRSFTALKRYYLGTAIILAIDILWYIYYSSTYIKLIQKYPL